jgi:hypothetical protein
VDAISWRSWREEFLHLNFQDFGEKEQRLVVDVRKACLDFRDAAATDVKTRELQFSRQIGLRPTEAVSATPHLRTDVVFVAHVDVLSALFGFRLCRFKADARRAFNLAKLDELSCAASGQRIGYLFAKIRDRF